MTESRHTPGPWKPSGPTGAVKSEAGQLVAMVYGDDPECAVDDRMCANANLIAAAPRLLEALKLIIADRDETGAEFVGRPIPIRNSSIDAARAAIARAEGQS
jgi:hypothetical protein